MAASSRYDFFAFAGEFLQHLYPLPFAKFHREIIKNIEKGNRTVILIPREHGKTTLLLGYVIYSIIARKYRFILFISQSQTQARRLASTAKIEFETNPKIREKFGDMKGEIWQAEEMSFINGTRLIIAGIGTGIRGMNIQGKRPDLIILDDVETDKHHYSQVESEKLKNIFKNAILNLGKEAKIIVIGTMGARHGLLYELSESPHWKTIRYSAIENGKPLWPQKWSMRDLENKRLEIGEVAFMREFMNELATSEQVFQPQEVETVPPGEYEYYGGIDFATGRGKDYNAFVVIAKNKQGDIYVIEAYKTKRLDYFVSTVILKCKHYTISRIFAEKNNFQELVVKELAKAGIPVVGITNTKPKQERLMALSTVVNAGVIKFLSHKTFELLKEIYAYPYSQNDDLLDALEIAYTHSKKAIVKAVW